MDRSSASVKKARVTVFPNLCMINAPDYDFSDKICHTRVFESVANSFSINKLLSWVFIVINITKNRPWLYWFETSAQDAEYSK